MKILFGSIVVDARGRLNGHVFKKTATGHAITKLALPRNREKWQQNKQLGAMAKVLAHWKILNSNERLLVNSFAEANPIPNKFGIPVNIGGRAMFQRLTFGFNFPVSSYPSTTKLSAVIPSTEIAVLGVDASTGNISFDVLDFDRPIILNIWVQQTENNTDSPPSNKWRRIPNLPITSAGVKTSPDDIMNVLLFPLQERKNWVKFQICNASGFGLYNNVAVLTID